MSSSTRTGVNMPHNGVKPTMSANNTVTHGCAVATALKSKLSAHFTFDLCVIPIADTLDDMSCSALRTAMICFCQNKISDRMRIHTTSQGWYRRRPNHSIDKLFCLTTVPSIVHNVTGNGNADEMQMRPGTLPSSRVRSLSFMPIEFTVVNVRRQRKGKQDIL
jgi:hypothetical protein